jgi:OmpA-OmpF porin, OOP family
VFHILQLQDNSMWSRIMKTRFPMIAAAALIAVPFTAQAAEQELDPARLAELVCQFGGDCAAPAAEAVSTGGDDDLVVAVRGTGARGASPFPTFDELRKMKTQKKTGVAALTSTSAAKPSVGKQRLSAAPTATAAPGKRNSAGAVEAAEAVAKRANLFVTFRLGSAELEPSALKEINAVAEAIRVTNAAGKVKKVRIAGHTDATGDDAVNTKLSADRAASVRQALLDRGISADMLEAEGFGSTQPIDGYATTHGINRRVEAVVIE